MLTSIGILLIVGLLFGSLFTRLKLPGLLGMMIAGILLSPHCLNWLSSDLMAVSGDLRKVALVVILSRAGLSLNLSDLKKAGRPGILLCFVPACFEILAITLLAPLFLGVTTVEAAIMGAVIAAVSPAVVVPRMIRLMDEGYGVKKGIPQMILAGASVDDVFVIVLFTAFTALADGGAVSAVSFLEIPLSIVLGVAMGVLVGLGLLVFFSKFTMRNSVQLLIFLGLSFLMLAVEDLAPVSGLLAIMAAGITINQKNPTLAKALGSKYNKIWVGAEIMLFVLVGATVDMQYALAAGVMAILLVVCALAVRMVGVYTSVVGTKLSGKERLFTMMAYTPKATVQAAIGAIPLSMGLPCGQMVLTVAVLSILITAPFGAITMDRTYQKLLSENT